VNGALTRRCSRSIAIRKIVARHGRDVATAALADGSAPVRREEFDRFLIHRKPARLGRQIDTKPVQNLILRCTVVHTRVRNFALLSPYSSGRGVFKCRFKSRLFRASCSKLLQEMKELVVLRRALCLLNAERHRPMSSGRRLYRASVRSARLVGRVPSLAKLVSGNFAAPR